MYNKLKFIVCRSFVYNYDVHHLSLLLPVDIFSSEVAEDSNPQHGEDDVEFDVSAEGVAVPEPDSEARTPPQHVVGKGCLGSVREKRSIEG